jgi:SAM-dependent methyltransferase
MRPSLPQASGLAVAGPYPGVVVFEVGADSYRRFMGRFSEALAVPFARAAAMRAGQRVLDVGCGPGALTAQLVQQLGADAVWAVDPSASFVTAIRDRFPAVTVQHGVAERLPFADSSFDAALAQLVVHFMTDPVRGLAEMARVTRAGGLVAACVWDHAGGTGPLAVFWRAVHDLDPGAGDEAGLSGTAEGELADLCVAAGLQRIEPGSLTVEIGFASIADWWEPYTLGVGPAGAYVAQLDQTQRQALRARCEQILPPAPFHIRATAWSVLGRV